MGINAQQIAALAPAILFAVVLHEIAHGWVANRLGDPTAARMGRLTLNPIAHIDLFGTILIPLLLVVAQSPFLFGYAKPVPVNFYKLRNPKRDMIWVAAAGPIMNLFLALCAVLFLKSLNSLFGGMGTFPQGWLAANSLVFFHDMAIFAVQINVLLAVFNMFPLPPLDGGRVLVGLLPEPYSSTVARIEPFGFLILVTLLMTHMLDKMIGPPMRLLLNLYSGLL